MFFDDLGIAYSESGPGFTFSNALAADTNIYALKTFDDVVVLFNRFIGYDYSYEQGTLYVADMKLGVISNRMDVLVFVFDSNGDWVSFSYFSKGKRVRCWASSEGRIITNEGTQLEFEKNKSLSNDLINKALPEVFQFTTHEDYLMNVIENFGGFGFQNELQNERENFTFYR